MGLGEAADKIETRHDLAHYVGTLREDLLKAPDSWENPTLERYLEAMAAWINDMDGYFKNQGLEEPPQPTWNLVGQILLAATLYE